MNLKERCQTVFQAGYQFGQNSFRTVAQKTDLSKSSVHRLYHRLVNRNQYPESELWETEAGQKWLRLLVLAAIFIFALQGGIGCERLSGFFHLLRLQRHIGVSPTALRSLRARMESAIIEYQKQQNEVISKISSEVDVGLAADETFFDQVILVMLDLPSGYIFTVQTTDLVSQLLQDIQANLQNIYTTHRLQDPRNGIRKLKNQIQSLSAIVDLWWSWVDQC